MLAFSNDYYGFIFRVTQSVELFCTYLQAGLDCKKSGPFFMPSNKKEVMRMVDEKTKVVTDTTGPDAGSAPLQPEAVSYTHLTLPTT